MSVGLRKKKEERGLLGVRFDEGSPPHIRTMLADRFLDDALTDNLMTPSSQLFAEQGRMIQRWSVDDHTERLGWDAVQTDLPTIGDHYFKTTTIGYKGPGSSDHLASAMSWRMSRTRSL